MLRRKRLFARPTLLSLSSAVTREWVAACRMAASSSAHLGRPTEHGRAKAEKVGHLSLDFVP